MLAASRLTVEQLLDVLGLDMPDLVELLEKQIEESAEEIERAVT